MSRWKRRTILVATVLSASLGACGPCREEEKTVGRTYPEALQWTLRADDGTYRVQAWSGLRLLFEESVADTVLPLTPSLLHAMAPFDSCRIEVRAIGASRRAPEVFWVRKEP